MSIPLKVAIAHDEATLHLIRGAQRHLDGTCGCPGIPEGATEHEPACTANFMHGVHAAEGEVAAALAGAAHHLEVWIDRRKLELRIEALEAVVAEGGGAR